MPLIFFHKIFDITTGISYSSNRIFSGDYYVQKNNIYFFIFTFFLFSEEKTLINEKFISNIDLHAPSTQLQYEVFTVSPNNKRIAFVKTQTKKYNYEIVNNTVRQTEDKSVIPYGSAVIDGIEEAKYDSIRILTVENLEPFKKKSKTQSFILLKKELINVVAQLQK